MLSIGTEQKSIAVEAQQVHTEAYLRVGLIDEIELNEDGRYIDEYTARSVPFVSDTGDKEASFRMILADKKSGEGILSLPTLGKFRVDPGLVKDISGVTRLSNLRPRDVVEISGLGAVAGKESAVQTFDATRQVYAKGLRYSLDQGHKLWVMNIEERLSKQLSLFLGKDAITQIGDEREYRGPATIPFALSPQDVVESILLDEGRRFSDTNKEHIRAEFQGLSEKHLPAKLVDLLHENDIETTPATPLEKAWKHKLAIGSAGLMAYSTGRAVPLVIGAVPEFHGNPYYFGGLDIVTAVTQIYIGQELYFKSKNARTRALGATLAVVSFAAPYAYVYGTGEGYPWYVNTAAGLMVGGAVIGETLKSIKDHKLREDLEATDLLASDKVKDGIMTRLASIHS